MELNRFKYHLSCILGRYKDMGDPSGDGDQLHSGPLFMYRQDVRTLVGRVLCPLTNETGLPGPYVPVFYQKSPPILAGKHAEVRVSLLTCLVAPYYITNVLCYVPYRTS